MSWTIDFISEEQLHRHVANTIQTYGKALCSYDLQEFNKSIIDPIKLLFDKSIYGASWKEIIDNEIFRQRDKSVNNTIGYFHQNIFRYIPKCDVPRQGWDVIFTDAHKIQITDEDTVSRVFVEMKNKHNTMNSASSAKTYMKMQDQLLSDDDCACYLVEAIAKRSQDIKWIASVDGKRVQHRRIRRVSMDRFYSLVTGEEDAFYQICLALPRVIKDVLDEKGAIKTPHDTVYEELKETAHRTGMEDQDLAMAVSLYLLGFPSYNGFNRYK